LNTTKVVRAITALAAIFFIAVGLWALISPQSFFDTLAGYRPYNKHFLHDVGAFQTGIGATLLLALFRRDALQVVLWGTSVGTVLHAISHFIDRDAPGAKSTDPLALSAVALLVLVAAVLHQNQLSQRKRQRS
jgi:hypothetical protein